MNIHPTALVDSAAKIADDVTVGPFAIIEADVEIESGCEIGPSALIASGARLGKNVKIYKSAVVSGDPQDLKFLGGRTYVYIGDNTVIREFVTLHRGTEATGKTIIGSDCFIMAYCHVAHDCVVGNRVILANSVNLGGHVILEDWAIIGGVAPVHQFVRVGAHVMIGGGFRVTKDVPPFIMAAYEPLKFEGLNLVGLRRRGFSPERIAQIKSAYRLIYLNNLNVSQGIAKIKDDMEITPDIQHIIDFIEQSKRGII
jgi:UDP-N-acetylglucosamine acyltransferase